jgi:RHS repeat-associated protein
LHSASVEAGCPPARSPAGRGTGHDGTVHHPTGRGPGPVRDSAGTTTYQLADLHGDVVGTSDTAGTLASANGTTDEYGTPRDTSTIGQRRYGWLGTKQRAADAPGGLTLMGVRLYNPTTGRFLQTDPVKGGSANAYDYVYQDPINKLDLDGRCWGGGDWCHPIKEAKKAYRQAIRGYAVIPYAGYYGGYRYNRWASKRSRWNPAHLLRPVGWLAQADGISRDAAVDWVKGHTGFHESVYDEHQHGHLNPFHGPGRGHTWLPGLYRRRGHARVDWAW